MPGNQDRQHRESRVDRLLRYPSGTAVAYGLLLALTVLSGVFVGEEVALLAFPPSAWDSTVAGIPVWLAPMMLLALTVGLTLLYPRWRERRGAWVPVPDEVGRVAIARVAELCASAPRVPAAQLMWQPTATDQAPFVYGRPGHYRLWISPQGVGAARRRPESFDSVVRHELAHLANRDVFVGRFAVVSWYVTMSALVLTPLVRVIVRLEWQFLGEYAVRAVVLGLALTLVRDRLLRLREHYADVRAAAWAGTGQSLIAVLSGRADAAPRPAWRRVFGTHPTPAERIQVIADPTGLGRLSAVEFLSVGLMAGAGWPVISRLAMALIGGWATSGMAVFVADGLARAFVFGLLGAHAGLTVARAAAARELDRRSLAAAVGSSVLGVVIGFMASPQQLGLVGFSGSILINGLVTAVLAAGFAIIFAADTAQVRSGLGVAPPPRSLAGFGAACAALAAVAALPISELASPPRFGALLWLAATPFGILPLSLGLVAVAVSLWILARTRRVGPLLVGIGLGLGAGLVGTAASLMLNVVAGHEGLLDGRFGTPLNTAAMVAVVMAVGASMISSVAVRAGALVGVLGGATSTVVSTVGIYLLFNFLGAYVPATDVPAIVQLIAGPAVVFALPLAAAASLARRLQAPGPMTHSTRT